MEENLHRLLDRRNIRLAIEAWQSFSARTLRNRIHSYPTFQSIMLSLEKHEDAVSLLRCYFCGFLEDVTQPITDVLIGDFLTAQGVLIKRDLKGQTYSMASPLIDGLIRSRVSVESVPYAIRHLDRSQGVFFQSTSHLRCPY